MRLFIPEFNFSAGTETVLLKILPHWAQAGHDVFLAAPVHRLRRYQARGIDPQISLLEPGWQTHGWQRIFASLTRLTSNKRWRTWLHGSGLRHQANRLGATHVFIPWVVGHAPVRFQQFTGIMLMDLAWRHYPEGWFGPPSVQLDAQMGAWLNSAQKAFPISMATASEFAAAFPNYADKLVTVPHGAEWHGTKSTLPSRTDPFFLTPATPTPNKGHAVLLDAAIRLWRQGADFRLVWTGSGTKEITRTSPSPERSVRALRQLYQENQSLIDARLETRGFVSDKELSELYRQARQVVLPSSYEGFGLPMLEAFAHGARVICSAIPSFQEQVKRYHMQDCTTLVPPGDAASLAQALLRSLTASIGDTPSEDALRARLGTWTWHDAAQLYLDNMATT